MLPYRSVKNVIEGVVLTFTDVTQMKRAAQLVEDAKAYAENIVETVRSPLLVLDAETRVKSANTAFYEVFQVGSAETLNTPLYKLGNGQWDIPLLRRLLGELLPQKQRIEDFEVEHDFPAIGRKVMLLDARQILQQGDNQPLILLSIEDVTARKMAEEKLRHVTEELRSANEDLKHFSYAAAHDLQEPLRMVMSYTQLLAREYKGELGATADKFIAHAVGGAERMEALLTDLREYWSVNEQRVEKLVPVDCNRVLEKALAYLEMKVRESGAVVTHDFLPTVMAEELPLTLLFQNLIGNAIKYRRPDEPPRITISAAREDGAWNFAVTDNGIGIDAEFLQMIFAPFKRLHGREYPGTGIGLALCQKIVERYRGRIWAESAEGRGSAFHFTIPAKGGAE